MHLGLTVPTSVALQVDYQASSIGRLSHNFANMLFSAMRGLDETQKRSDEDRLNIIYPSRTMALLAPNRVRANDIHRTKPTAGTQYYKMLDSGLKDLELGSPLSHAKIIRVRRAPLNESAKDTKANWLYIGSHNLSSTAWVRSYECGVILQHSGDNWCEDGVVRMDLRLDGPRYPVHLMWDN